MSNQTQALANDFDKFVLKTKKLEYKTADEEIKAGASRIQSKLPADASRATLDSFRKYRYSNNGASRKLKYKIATKKISSGYTFEAHLGQDQNLAHLFQDGFDLKQRYGFTRVNPIMKIDFETESSRVANAIVQKMNSMKGE